MRHGQRIAFAFTSALLIIVSSVFGVAFVASSRPEAPASPIIDAQSYAADVAAALAGASAAEGAALIEAFQCSACHIAGADRVAPTFAGIAALAATRRPPLSAAQYLYESIVTPSAVLVEGYANAMPANFADRLTQAEIGHIIAYLLAA